MDEIEKKILSSSQLEIKSKVKNLLFYTNRKRGAKRSWNNRHRKVLQLNPEYSSPCDKGVENEHKKLWAPFRKNVDLTTIRISRNISGKADPRMIPEDLFVSDIEPSLMINPMSHFLSHKSFYNQWFSEGLFPKDYFHRINNQYLDRNLNHISFNQFEKMATEIPYPIVLKPNTDSYGGENVYFVKDVKKLLEISKTMSDFVIQEKIEQFEFFKKYNPVGLNTFRVYVYRSVIDDQYHVVNIALRMGKGGSLDNETAGGIHSLVHNDGSLNNYAVSKYGVRFEEHPDTGLKFDKVIPKFDDLIKLSIEVSQKIFFTRIIALDACLDVSGKWRMIEVNTQAAAIRLSQYGGVPFFGDFTEEVIEYCKSNHWALI